jgi:hypothetical protein
MTWTSTIRRPSGDILKNLKTQFGKPQYTDSQEGTSGGVLAYLTIERNVKSYAAFVPRRSASMASTLR